MANNEMRTGICPHCKEALEVPAHLEQFSCLYCGSRLAPSDFEAPISAKAPTKDQGAEAAAVYRSRILEVMTEYKNIEQSLSKNGYAPAIEQYEAGTRPIFEAMDLACQAGVFTPEEAAAEFLDQLEASWTSKHKKWVPGKSLNNEQETQKFRIAIFLVPMIRKMGLSASESYCASLQQQWINRYPKSPFSLGTYEEIMIGFQKKFMGLCFITTAVCQKDGKPDNCPELTSFRNFRDGYLRSCEDGPALIDAYYEMAPSIVLALELSPDRDAKYDAIWQKYLSACYEDIQAGRLKQCKERYTAMVKNLEKEYLS